MLKIGVKAAALPPDALRDPLLLLSALFNPYIIGGIVAFAASMVLWLGAISGQQLSSVYPMAALGYVIVTIASVRIFHDTITVPKVAGILLILLGVVILNLGASPVGGNGSPITDGPRQLRSDNGTVGQGCRHCADLSEGPFQTEGFVSGRYSDPN
ncbi:MAG: DMT family transporter [Acidiferrobacteraceae bacterium]